MGPKVHQSSIELIEASLATEVWLIGVLSEGLEGFVAPFLLADLTPGAFALGVPYENLGGLAMMFCAAAEPAETIARPARTCAEVNIFTCVREGGSGNANRSGYQKSFRDGRRRE